MIRKFSTSIIKIRPCSSCSSYNNINKTCKKFMFVDKIEKADKMRKDESFCGVDAKTLNAKINAQDREVIFEISERSKTNPRLILAAEDTNSDGTLKDQWGQFLFNVGEEENSDENGLTCLVDKNKFIIDIKTVQLDKVCKNESPQRRKITEEYLRELQRRLKKS